MTKLDRGWRD